MDKKSKLDRSVWKLVQFIKDFAVNETVQSAGYGNQRLNKDQLQELSQHISILIETGYHRAHKNFQKEMELQLKDDELNVLTDLDLDFPKKKI